MVKKKRPVNLALTSIKLPLTAYASILHRISGFFLFFVVGFLLYILDLSLKDEEGFNQIHVYFKSTGFKVVVWIMLSSLIYHFVAGVRHLLMDMGWAEGKESGRNATVVVFIVTLILVVLLGVRIW